VWAGGLKGERTSHAWYAGRVRVGAWVGLGLLACVLVCRPGVLSLLAYGAYCCPFFQMYAQPPSESTRFRDGQAGSAAAMRGSVHRGPAELTFSEH
jgi:hypothetical protein